MYAIYSDLDTNIFYLIYAHIHNLLFLIKKSMYSFISLFRPLLQSNVSFMNLKYDTGIECNIHPQYLPNVITVDQRG